jgi:hypothetical protein
LNSSRLLATTPRCKSARGAGWRAQKVGRQVQIDGRQESGAQSGAAALRLCKSVSLCKAGIKPPAEGTLRGLRPYGAG